MKKSVIQIIVLVLLVVVGAGFYLYTQGGIGFIDDLIGTSAPPPPAPPPPREAAKPKDESPVIPAHPVKGSINKSEFVPNVVEIESGTLTLRQGEGPLATEVKVFLYTRPWEIPAGRSFKLMQPAGGGSSPHIRVRSPEAGQSAPRQREYTEKYTLLLELGPEQDKKIPGKIYLALPDDDKSQVAGTFEAAIRGFRVVDGKPDLSSDSVDTLQFLALRELLGEDASKPVRDVSFHRGAYDLTPAGGVPPTGYLEVSYRLGDGALTTQKFQYAKENGAWRVVRTLRPDQLQEAHPLKPPSAKDTPERLFPYLAAKRIEADVKKRAPNQLITNAEFSVRANEALKIGVCEASYNTDNGQPVQTAFLFRRGANGWRLERELNKKERVNFATGKVETQR
ncbi:MAG: hypothetical protein ACLGHO_02030 [Gammaproteobacteria bacterium]